MTITIAADNTVDKSTAQYVCDGVDDQATINAAIAMMDAYGGGNIVLLAGTYYISGTVLFNYTGISDDNIIFSGQGDTSILKIPDGHSTDMTMIWVQGGGTPTIKNVTLKDFKVDGNGANTTGVYSGIRVSNGENITIENITIGDGNEGSNYAIYNNQDTANLTVTDCRIGTWGINGLELRHVNTGTISNNIFTSSRFELYSSNNDLTISGNTFNTTRIMASTDDHINRMTNIAITGNSFVMDHGVENPVILAMLIDGLTITGNTFDCYDPPVTIADCTDVTHEDNIQL